MTISLAHKAGKNPFDSIKALMSSHAAYVGIPSSSKDRRQTLLDMALKAKPGKTGKLSKRARRVKAVLAADNDVTNAELLFIHTKGSQMKGIPPRPVIEPAIEAPDNKKIISRELAGAAKAAGQGDQKGMMKGLKRAAMAGQNASRKWFTDDRNHWAPNKPETIARKGSDKPLIDTGALRASIIGVVK
jgi:hypothetical protein